MKGKISKTGYKKNSKDKNNDFNIIPSNLITMKDVEFPVLGISDKNDIKIMKPNKNYKFEGSTVTEFPLIAKSGIHIKPENKGKFTKKAKAKGKGVQEYASQVLANKDNYSTSTVKQAVFAKNAKKWKKGQAGLEALNPQGSAPIQLNDGFQSLIPLENNQIDQFGMTADPMNIGNVGQGMKQSNIMGSLGGATGILNTATDLYKGVQMLQEEKKKKKSAKQFSALSNLIVDASTGPVDKPKRKYHRPEDQIVDPNALFPTYGTGTNYLAKSGKNIKKAQLGTITSSLGSKAFGGTGEQSGAGQIGQTAGSVIGNMILPGVGGIIGGALGGFVGGAIGSKNQKETANMQKQAQMNMQNAAYSQDIHNQYSSFMEHGGKVSMDGDLMTHWGGKMKTTSYNPFLPDGGESVEFVGKSHAEGGIGVTFGSKPVEVEGGEPAQKLKNGDNLTVFGDMKIPDYGVVELEDKEAKGKKFKSYIKTLNKEEAKQNKKQDKALSLIDEANPVYPLDSLKMNSGKAILEGSNMKLKNIAKKKEIASIVQNAILETAEEKNLDPTALSKGSFKKAKKGTFISKYQTGGDEEIKRVSRSEIDELNLLQEGWEKINENRYGKKTIIPGETTVSEAHVRQLPKTEKLMDSEKWFNTKVIPELQRGVSPEELRSKGWLSKDYLERAKQYYTKSSTSTPDKEKWQYLDVYDPANFNIPSVEPETVPMEQPVQANNKTNWLDVLNTALPFLRPSNQTNLDPNQLAGEMYAMASNQLEPVQAQLYHPLLEQPFDISLQDQLNANQADFNALQRAYRNNPAALSALAAQKYQANSSVLGEQFRQNQANKMGVFNRNRATLNDAQLKNLGILDQQYVRQAQAKSNTKAVAQSALSSIADKIQKHKLENRTLGIYENMYNYRFGPRGYAWNWNPAFNPNIPQVGENLETYDPNVKTSEEYRQKYDKMNLPEGQEYRKKTTKSGKNGMLVKAMKGSNLKNY